MILSNMQLSMLVVIRNYDNNKELVNLECNISQNNDMT